MSDPLASAFAAIVARRRSVRGFLPTPVDGDVIRRVVERAAWAPSGGNLQPWHIDVVGGEKLDELKRIMLGKLMGGFWSSVSTTSTGTKRSSLDQARMQLLQQLL